MAIFQKYRIRGSSLSKLFPTARRSAAGLKRHKVPLILIVLFIISSVIALLSLMPLTDANAGYVKNGDFRIAMTISERVLYEGKDLNIAMILENSSNMNQFIRFGGACQATFKIVNVAEETVFPRFAEEHPCNNSSFEEFIMSPAQQKHYYFTVKNEPFQSPILAVGKYKIVGFIDGFGQTDPLTFEVIAGPVTAANEGELCEGLTGRVCREGLECKFRGGFQEGAGMCMPTESTYLPADRCVNGSKGCFGDIRNHPNRAVIEKFILLGRISGFDDGSFKPDNFMTVPHFEKIATTISGKIVKIDTTDVFVRRDTAIAALYKAFISTEYPRNLTGSPYKDITLSPYKDFIDACYKLGVISPGADLKFNPNAYLTRAHAIVMIDRFERNR